MTTAPRHRTTGTGYAPTVVRAVLLRAAGVLWHPDATPAEASARAELLALIDQHAPAADPRHRTAWRQHRSRDRLALLDAPLGVQFSTGFTEHT